jgi:hypothetical protein
MASLHVPGDRPPCSEHCIRVQTNQAPGLDLQFLARQRRRRPLHSFLSAGKRDDFVDRYFQHAKNNAVVVILKPGNRPRSSRATTNKRLN